MASVREMRSNRGGWGGGTLLKGSDLPKGAKSFTVFVHGVIEAPANFTSPLICRIDETQGSNWLPLNMTNVSRLEKLLGDDFSEWGGYEVTFKLVSTKNPQTNQPAIGIEVDSVKKSKKKVEMDDVPF